MHRKRWLRIWFMAAIVAILVTTLLFFAHVHLDNHVLSNYLEDIAGAITVIVLSVATYEEWESRHELGRSKISRDMGTRRIKDEVFQLLYEYAFVLNMRWDTNSEAVKTIKKLTVDGEYSHVATELHAKTAKHLSQEDLTIKSTLFATSCQALSDLKLSKQTYLDMDELITQTERSIDRIDTAIAIYGHSFTPEVHEWAVNIRESLERCISGRLSILSIRLTSVTARGDKKLSSLDRQGTSGLVTELIEVGVNAARKG